MIKNITVSLLTLAVLTFRHVRLFLTCWHFWSADIWTYNITLTWRLCSAGFQSHKIVKILWHLHCLHFDQKYSSYCAVLPTCQLEEMSTANNREKIFVWKNNHNDYLNDLGLSFYICHKYFLQLPVLLQTPSHIFSNALPLSLPLSLSLRYLALVRSFPFGYLTMSCPINFIIE